MSTAGAPAPAGCHSSAETRLVLVTQFCMPTRHRVGERDQAGTATWEAPPRSLRFEEHALLRLDHDLERIALSRATPRGVFELGSRARRQPAAIRQGGSPGPPARRWKRTDGRRAPACATRRNQTDEALVAQIEQCIGAPQRRRQIARRARSKFRCSPRPCGRVSRMSHRAENIRCNR